LRTSDLLDELAFAKFDERFCADPPENAVYKTEDEIVLTIEGFSRPDGRSTVGVPCWRGEGLLNNHVVKFEPKSDLLHKRFAEFAHAAEPVCALIASAAQGTIAVSAGHALREVSIPLPPIEQQRRIARFLDVETARIDTLIKRESQMIELLQERVTAAILSLVATGLNPPVSSCYSGVEPLGSVPAHWRVARNKAFMREVADLSTTGAEELLTVSHITGVTPRKEKAVNMFMAESLEGYKMVAPGDLVINTMWAWMGALGVAKHSGIVSPAYGVYRIDPSQADPAYLDYLFRSPPYVTEITRYSRGVWTSRLRLYPEVFLSLKCPLPPLDEQRAIAAKIGELEQESMTIINRLEEAVRLLGERRDAVITAAVNGELDLSEAA
jgi:type I restriction enzyme S subunit